MDESATAVFAVSVCFVAVAVVVVASSPRPYIELMSSIGTTGFIN